MADITQVAEDLRKYKAGFSLVMRRVTGRIRSGWLRRGALTEPARLPDKLTAQLGRQIRRTVLIANNVRMDVPHVLRGIPRPDDLIVQFNRCLHFSRFLDAECAKLFVFRAIGPASVTWGYPPDKTAFDGIDTARLRGDKFLMFINLLPPPELAPPALREIAHDPAALTYAHAFSPPFETYPRVPIVQSPTSGFMVLQLLFEERARLRALGGGDFEIALAGFTDPSRPRRWSGHNWAHERSFVRANRHDLTVLD